MKMKAIGLRDLRILTLSALLGISVYGCAHDDEASDGDEVTADDSGTTEGGSEEGADATAEETPSSDNPAANAPNVANTPNVANAEVPAPAAEQVAAPVDTAATMPPPADVAAAAPVAPNTAALPATPNGSGVRYVKVASCQVYSQGNTGSSVVGQMQKGDHFYAVIENGWAKLSDGRFVQAEYLSEEGVGRTRRHATWHQGH